MKSSSLICDFQEVKSEEDLKQIFDKLPDDTVDLVVKTAIELKLDGKPATFLTNSVLNMFKNYYFLRTKDYKAIYEGRNGVTWCLKDDSWVLCTARIEPEKKQYNSKYVGIIGDTDKFCVRSTAENVATDKRKISTGAVCEEGGWLKKDIINILKELNIVSEEDTSWKMLNKKELCEMLKSWFGKNNLLEKGKCGTARKKKI